MGSNAHTVCPGNTSSRFPWGLGQKLLAALLLAMLGTNFGCAMEERNTRLLSRDSTRHGQGDEWRRDHRTLIARGRLTEAAVLKGLHDSANWLPQEYRAPAGRYAERPTRKPAKEAVPQPKAALPTPPELTLPAPEAHKQKTHLDGTWHVRLGWSLMINGNHGGAAAAYREALRQNPNLAEAYLGLGILLRRQANLDGAGEAFRRALALKPGYAAALVHLGYVYADDQAGRRDLAKAQQLFTLASRQGDPFATIALLDLRTRRR